MTTFDDYRREFEQLVAYDGMRATSKIHICQKIMNLSYKNNILFNASFEKDLLLLWFNIFWIFKRISKERHSQERRDFVKKLNEATSDFTRKHKKDSSYYLNRCNTSKNSSDMIRYSFACWLLNKDSKYLELTVELAGNTITNSLSKDSKEITDYILPCDLLSYSYTLVTLYMFKNSKLKKIIKDKASEIISDAIKNKFPRWLIEPSEIICNLEDIQHDFSSSMISNLQYGAYLLSNQKRIDIDNRISNCSLERSLLDISIKFIKFLSVTEAEKDNMKKVNYSKIANSYEREAELREKKGDIALVLANICYLPAAKYYRLAGNNRKQNENFILFQQSNYFPPDAYTEYQMIIRNTINFEGDNEDTIIESISKNEDIIPDEESIRREIDENVKQNPLLLSIPHQKLSQHGPATRLASSEEEIKNNLMNERMVLHIQFHENLISKSIQKLEHENKISVNGIMKYLSNFLLLDENSLELVRIGITYHFKQEFVSSMHILVPQLENILRVLIKNSNVNILKEENNIIMDKQFRGLLEIPELSHLIGKDFTNYLKLKYADIKSINLRNDISHGLLKLIDFNHTNSTAIICGILILLRRYKKYQ